jgi:RNA polymerase sigma-70 factor (ECF subfamily)
VALDTRTDTDAELIARFCKGDLSAFAELYSRHKAGIYGYALGLTGDEQDAADLTQEMWLRIVEDPTRLLRAHHVKAYLYGSVRNQMIDGLRKRQRERRTITEAAPATQLIKPRDTAAGKEEAQRVDKAIRRLPPEQREVVLLKIYGELTFAEIAEVLEENPRTVESRHRLALDKLREWLKALSQGG